MHSLKWQVNINRTNFFRYPFSKCKSSLDYWLIKYERNLSYIRQCDQTEFRWCLIRRQSSVENRCYRKLLRQLCIYPRWSLSRTLSKTDSICVRQIYINPACIIKNVFWSLSELAQSTFRSLLPWKVNKNFQKKGIIDSSQNSPLFWGNTKL
jgi:hypothetical protein